jgi:hypothetical protein
MLVKVKDILQNIRNEGKDHDDRYHVVSLVVQEIPIDPVVPFDQV